MGIKTKQRRRMKWFQFITTCVEAPAKDIEAMVEQATEITPRTFARNCDYIAASIHLGYMDRKGQSNCVGLTLGNDYTTSFYKSTYQEQPCYYFVHSAIEYVYI